MAARHGTRRRYTEGCRCDECRDAQRLYQQRYRERRANGDVAPVTNVTPEPDEVFKIEHLPGPVESGVTAEIDGLAAQARPGLAQAALALARVLDNPRAVNQHAAAAKVLSSLLDKLRAASARGRRGGLAVVRTMTEKDGA